MKKINSVVCGHGINDIEAPTKVNGKTLKYYDVWASMLKRCYSTNNTRQSYTGCTVCDEWLRLSTFKKWFDENYTEGFQLDKDILVEGNKVYSPENCVFVPSYINNLVLDSGSIRGKLPIGISMNRNRYRAQCRTSVSRRQLYKSFDTLEEAQVWYSATKKRVVKEQAIKAFLANEIKSDVYLALVRREF